MPDRGGTDRNLEHRFRSPCPHDRDTPRMLAPRRAARKMRSRPYVDERLRRKWLECGTAGAGVPQSRWQRYQVHIDGGVAADCEAGDRLQMEISFPRARHRHWESREAQVRIFSEFEQADERISAKQWRYRSWLEHLRKHRQAIYGRQHHAGRVRPAPGRRSKYRSSCQPRTVMAAEQKVFAGPDLSGNHHGDRPPRGEHRGIADRPAADNAGRTDLHGFRHRVEQALMPERAWQARPCCSITPSTAALKTSKIFGGAARPHAMQRNRPSCHAGAATRTSTLISFRGFHG